jgi:hypothetical protein
MTVKVITSFTQMRDDELAVRANNIIEKMTGNTDFPTPFPALADVTTALTEYDQALEQSQNGGTDKTAIKNNKRQALEGLLGKLGKHVEVHCKNDRAIVLGSGFDMWKASVPKATVLEKPVNFTLVNGPYPGSVNLSVAKTPGAGSYVFEYAATPVTETTLWTKAGVTSRTHTFAGLTRGQEYAFRVTGVGIDVTPVYSDVISVYVQ